MCSVYYVCLLVFIPVSVALGVCAEGRNPFALPHQQKQTKRGNTLVLEGVVQCKDVSCVVLSSGSKRDTVPLKGSFEGHTVKEIGKNFVVVSKNDCTQRLSIE